MCAEKTLTRLGVHTGREVIHIQNVTADVRSRAAAVPKPGAIMAILP
jgi:hypothetical protein